MADIGTVDARLAGDSADDTFPPIAAEEFDVLKLAHPDAARDQLVGLAISGGGIRSATFGLGVLEALKEQELLRKVHYLSTVSGGGYIGGWLSANCFRASKRGEPDWRSKAADWSASIRHLRRYSNYLSPDVGFFSADTWSMFTIWIRNALLIQCTVAVCIACVLLLPRPIAWVFGMWPTAGNWRWTGVALFILGVVGIAGNLRFVSREREVWFLQAKRWPLGLALAATLVAGAALYCFVSNFRPFAEGAINPLHALAVSSLLVMAGYCALPAGVHLYGIQHDDASRPTQVNYAQRHVQLLIVAPMLISGLFVGANLWHLRGHELAGVTEFSSLFVTAACSWPFPLSVVFSSIFLLGLCSLRGHGLKNCVVGLFAAGASVLILHALFCAIVLLMHGWDAQHMQHAFVFAPALVLFAFSLSVVGLIGVVGRQSTEGVREWWSRFGAWLLIYGVAWMVVAVAAVYGPALIYAAFREYPAVSWSSVAGWAGTVVAGLVAGHSDTTGDERKEKAQNPIVGIVVALAPFLFIAGLLVSVATALDLVVRANAGDFGWPQLFDANARATMSSVALVVLIFCVVVAGLLGQRIDVNEFSLNAFYRNRLVRCFLGATRLPNAKSPALEANPDPETAKARKRSPQYFTAFDNDDDLPLAALGGNGVPPVGPLHIVNCALNLGGSGDLSLHTRRSASFTLSPLHCGSHYRNPDDIEGPAKVGYMPTTKYGGGPTETTLGKAISVSGAAASPNMGYHTSPVVAFLLTVFNLRLGWWFPNPDGYADRTAPRFNLPYMFAELFGSATYRSRFLMVSDGGHFENLAVYELVKRKCAVIIASDAECDPALAFEGLGTLIRMCDVDLNAKIRIDVSSLRQRPGTDVSEHRCVVGTIEYDDGQRGTLIYLKATLTGLEPTQILQYKASHPTFPHESTGDQFYAEDQFESYRRLGYEVATQAFAAALAVPSAKGTSSMVTLADTMKKTLSPTLPHAQRFTTHTTALVNLWEKMRRTESLARLDAGMLGAAFRDLPLGAERDEAYTCVEMIQLMENVYLDLRLEDTWEHIDNVGWQALFQTWAASEAVKQTWERSSHLFGERFRYFWQRRLGN